VSETPEDLVAALRELLGCASIDGLERLSGGASRETYAFEAVDADGARRSLILQRDRPGAIRTGRGMDNEVAVLRAAGAHGVPVARLVADGDVAGAPGMVLERVEGETIARKILRDDEFAAARPVLAAQAGRALAGIHGVTIDTAWGLERQDQLTQYRSVLDSLGEAHPALELGFRRLEATRPRESRTTVVHGDFRTGNLIVDREGLRAVLDWELVHLGDPLEDLGWFCVRAWRFGSPHPAGGFGSYDELCAAYEEASGVPVDLDALRWWEAVGSLKWGVMCIMQARAHLLGLSRSVELAAIGRRVCENEHDLLVLLGSSLGTDLAVAPSPGEVPGSPPHDRPTAAELVEAVVEFLERDVMGETEGRLQFHARVARNALNQVGRELALGPTQAEAHRQRLDALGYADDAALAAAIRAGECDQQWNEVLAAVHASVLDKLAVANPSYI
jgi:aminoglycoside phosphotransferase (APT) family kinase protein